MSPEAATSGSLDVGGLPLAVETRGAGERTLLLIHGFGACRYTWRHWAPELARNHRVVLVDLKGFGEAPAPRDGSYSPVDHAGALVELVRRNDLRRLTLVGHSMGGGLALLTTLRLADQDPGRIERLVLVASTAFPQALPRYVASARIPLLGPTLLRVVPSRRLVRWVLREIVHDPGAVTDEQVEAYARALSGGGTRYATVRTARQIIPPDIDRWTDRYPEIEVPVLLLWGRQDRVIPLRIGRRLADVLPSARLHVLEGCGHIPPEEQPEASLAVVRDFLNGTAGAP